MHLSIIQSAVVLFFLFLDCFILKGVFIISKYPSSCFHLFIMWITLPGPRHFTKRGGLMFNPATFYWSTCICVLGVLVVPLSTNFLFDFVPTVRYSLFFFFLLCFSLDTFDGVITLF